MQIHVVSAWAEIAFLVARGYMNERVKIATKDLVKIALSIALIVVGSLIKIPIGIVPITLQMFMCFTITLLLQRKACIAIAIYIIMGLIGLPVFSVGGGFSYVLQPTFGYLIGFLFGSVIIGNIIPLLKDNKFVNILFLVFAYEAIVYIFGLGYWAILYTFIVNKALSLYTLFVSGFLVFLPTDLFWCVLSTYIYKKLEPRLHLNTQN